MQTYRHGTHSYQDVVFQASAHGIYQRTPLESVFVTNLLRLATETGSKEEPVRLSLRLCGREGCEAHCRQRHTVMLNAIPSDLPLTLPDGFTPYATKFRPESSGRRAPARRKNGLVGWFELEPSGPSYPYRCIKGKWRFDENLFHYPGGLRQAREGNQPPASLRLAESRAFESARLVTAEAPEGYEIPRHTD